MKHKVRKNLKKIFKKARKNEILLDGLIIYYYGFPGVTAVFNNKDNYIENNQFQINRILFQAIKDHSDLKYNSVLPFKDEEECLEKLWFASEKILFDEEIEWINEHLYNLLSIQKLKPINDLKEEKREKASFLSAILGYFKNKNLLEIDPFDKFINWKIPFLPLWEFLQELGKVPKEKIDNNYSLWELCDCLIELNLGYWIPWVSAKLELVEYSLKLNPCLLNYFIQDKTSTDFSLLISDPMKRLITICNNPRNTFYWRNGYSKDLEDVRMQNHQNSKLYISDQVRRVVWIRDNGACVKCGTEKGLFYKIFDKNEKLIGSNLQITCAKCAELVQDNNQIKKRYISNQVRKNIINRYNHKCAKCGRRPRQVNIDHIIPHVLGGATVDQNLQLYCYDCNMKKYNSIDL